MRIANKKYLLIFASLFGIFCFNDTVSAYSTDSYYDAIAKGDFIRYTAACNELDDLIENGVPDPHWGYIDITLSNNCQKDLVIPSGKKVRLTLKYATNEGGTLTNNTGDTITVENNAVLVLAGEASNTSPDKAVVNNSGRLFLTVATIGWRHGTKNSTDT